MKRLMTQLLNLPGVIVEESRRHDETLILSVRVDNKTAVCPRCSQTSYRLHQNRYHLVRDLQMGTYEVILRVNRRLGIDEISLVKGQGKFIVVLVDLEKHKLIGLVPERKQSEIEKVRQKWGEEVLAEIEEVSIDMSGNYTLVGIMHTLKEEFHSLFEESKDLGAGTLELIDWLKKAEPYYKKSVKTIKRWFAEIVGYFECRTTNGIVEGINNKLKVLKRCGLGFRNFNNFETRALLYWYFSDIS